MIIFHSQLQNKMILWQNQWMQLVMFWSYFLSRWEPQNNISQLQQFDLKACHLYFVSLWDGGGNSWEISPLWEGDLQLKCCPLRGYFPLVSNFLPEMPFLQLQDTLLHERMNKRLCALKCLVSLGYWGAYGTRDPRLCQMKNNNSLLSNLPLWNFLGFPSFAIFGQQRLDRTEIYEKKEMTNFTKLKCEFKTES